ncbi:protein YIPF1/2 [Entomortierella parvispora]|uniref:Protein YIP n=1 Tax=Entomortierella parvispora TaxID=205924 RepID=A0A9P3HIK6_9FUNG|nr:protein YIPF1/2 [Entomortierella parvispora]
MANKGAYSAIEIDDDELQFQSFETSSSSPSASGNISSSNSTPQPRPAGFGTAGTFDPHRTIQDQTVAKPIWSIDYYAKFFDVDTTQVMERCMASIIPKDNFLNVMGGSPDLYGPFWISTTVVFVLFVMSSIIDSIHAYMESVPYSYDIGHLTFAFATIYTYAFMIPAMIWGATKYFGCQPDLLEMLALYGYGLTVWVPVAFLSVAPWNLLRWILILAGGASSGVFLVRNMYPVLQRAEAQTSKAILILVVGLHVILTLILKYKFFSL